ncbi:hypothetical protein PYW08_001145 [Mythimna loreyi]|uniref:Uncharacterized protein n=2 Tax=Mythimna loreyi TaxID=667449 RepID=A0ACC2R1X7_9NEOP|nr:hypothetical protein PYW08_015990 [Mythimna loreyi]KAJ8729564.1 hypothetical protein PYW08_001145 [Mythimna loreyi]
MPRVQRSPPQNTANVNITQASSDSDIPQMISSSPIDDDVNITTRHPYKRPRPCCSPGAELFKFKKEIHDMLKTWKADQEAYLTKLCNEQSSSLNKLASDMVELKLQNQAIQKSNTEIEKNISFISQQYDDMLKQVKSLQQENQTYKHSIMNLETKIQDLQRVSRPSSIEIRNVPAVENETASDLTAIINKVGSIVDIKINNSDLRDVFRLPGKPDTIRPIIAEFSNVQSKTQLVSAVRKFNRTHSGDDRLNTRSIGLNGERRPIFISEHLPASSRKLYFAAKEFAKHNKYDYCWSSNGNIFLRKVTGAKHILIRSEQTLKDLELQVTQ